jgi:hypothetical protein
MTKNVIRLSESDLRRIVKSALNEIAPSTLDNALSQDPNLGDFDYETNNFSRGQWGNTIAHAISTIREGLQFYMDKMSEEGISNNKLLNDAINGLEAIDRFFLRKKKQLVNINSRLEDITKEEGYY